MCWRNLWEAVWGFVTCRDFLVNFVSDMLVGVVLVALYRWYQKADGRVVYEIRRVEGKNFWVEFLLDNLGRRTFQKGEVYYHVYVDRELEPVTATNWEERPDTKSHGKPYAHFVNLLSGPAFPRLTTSLGQLMLTGKGLLDGQLYYHLSTAYGWIPRQPPVYRFYEWIRGLLGHPIADRRIGKIVLRGTTAG